MNYDTTKNSLYVEHAVGWDMRGVKPKAAEGELLIANFLRAVVLYIYDIFSGISGKN